MYKLLPSVLIMIFFIAFENVSVIFGNENRHPNEQVNISQGTNNKGGLSCEKNIYHFGAKNNAETITHTFVLENKGKVNVQIKQVVATCGCTTTKLEKKIVQPGEKISLKMSVALKSLLGDVNKTVIVRLDTPDKQFIVLRLIGKSFLEIDTIPNIITFLGVKDDHKYERTLEIRSFKKNMNFSIKSVISKTKNMKVLAEIGKSKAKHKIKIKIYLPLGAKNFSSSIRIATSNPNVPYIDVMVYVKIKSDVEISPSELKLKIKTGAVKEYSRFINIASDKYPKFKILKVKAIDLIGVKIKIIRNSGKSALIRVSGLKAHENLAKGKILIYTDIPSMKEITVPIKIVQ